MNNTQALQAHKQQLEAIRNLPIAKLDQRPSLMAALLASVVDLYTDNSNLTEPNKALESHSYWVEMHTHLEALGFHLLGNGHFSAVYRHELLPQRAIKCGLKKEDSGAAYVAFCRMHQGRAGIPNVYDVQRHSGCYTVVLDELCEFDYQDDDHAYHLDVAYTQILGDEPWPENREYTEFAETCKEIRKFFEGIAVFDMHTGNIMFTSAGEPVITDPVSFRKPTGRLVDEAESLAPEQRLALIENAMVVHSED